MLGKCVVTNDEIAAYVYVEERIGELLVIIAETLADLVAHGN